MPCGGDNIRYWKRTGQPNRPGGALAPGNRVSRAEAIFSFRWSGIFWRLGQPWVQAVIRTAESPEDDLMSRSKTCFVLRLYVELQTLTRADRVPAQGRLQPTEHPRAVSRTIDAVSGFCLRGAFWTGPNHRNSCRTQ